MSDEIFANVQVPDSVQSVLQVGSLYNYENAIIISEVTQADLRAGLALKVNKAGDSMTGDLEFEDGLAVKLDGEIDYTVKSRDDANQLVLLDGNGKGAYLNGDDNEQPYYTDGTNSYRLLHSKDFTDGTFDSYKTWGNLIGTISDQTDLTAYIKTVIGGTGVIGRPNYSAGVTVTLLTYSGGVSGSYTVHSYTCPSNGFIFVHGSGNSSNPSGFKINENLIYNVSGDTFVYPVSAGDIVKGYYQSNNFSPMLTGLFFPQRAL